MCASVRKFARKCVCKSEAMQIVLTGTPPGWGGHWPQNNPATDNVIPRVYFGTEKPEMMAIAWMGSGTTRWEGKTIEGRGSFKDPRRLGGLGRVLLGPPLGEEVGEVSPPLIPSPSGNLLGRPPPSKVGGRSSVSNFFANLHPTVPGSVDPPGKRVVPATFCVYYFCVYKPSDHWTNPGAVSVSLSITQMQLGIVSLDNPRLILFWILFKKWTQIICL